MGRNSVQRKFSRVPSPEDLRNWCTCEGTSRRDFLKVGVLGGLGLTLGDYFSLQAAQAEALPIPLLPQAKAKSAIYIFLGGGMSHMDTFDPKPYAPIEYRGELGTVETNTGEVLGGLMRDMAKVADKYSVIRSMTHGEAAHERGTHNMLTGFKPSPAIQYPSYGSVVSQLYGPRQDLPPYIAIPAASDPFLGTGYLSSANGAFSVGGEPAADGFQVRDLNLPEGVNPDRMAQRQTLLASVDNHFRELEKSELLEAMDSYYQRAYALISSQHAREAFNVKAEPEEMQQMYGKNAFGMRCLLARRIVEAGGRFVTVMDGGWDHHVNIKKSMEDKMPAVDKGVAALLTDLANRGLLESTLVILASEFGRTVKLNKDGGRDHWPKAFSVMLAGGGVKGGIIHGKTDQQGGAPDADPVEPQDLGATIYTLLGIDPTGRLMSAGERPIDVIREGKIINNLV